MHNNTVSNTMSNKQSSLLRRKMQRPPEAIDMVFLRWFNWLVKDAKWRAYMRSKIKENELPVIEFDSRYKKHG